MVILPVSSLRVSTKAVERLFAALLRHGGAQNGLNRMQTWAELFGTIGYAQYEALDASIVSTVVPHGMPQDEQFGL